MSLFQNWVTDYFGNKLPLPKIMEQKKEKKKNMDSTGTETADKIVNKDDSKNRALTMTPSFDGLFYIETMGQKEEKKNADFKNTKTAETLNTGAGIDNVVAGGSKMKSRKKREIVFAPAFDGLFPYEMCVSRDHASR